MASCGCVNEVRNGILVCKIKCNHHAAQSTNYYRAGKEYFSKMGDDPVSNPFAPHFFELTAELGDFPDVVGKKMLEIGCGLSHYYRHFAARGYEYHACDTSPYAREFMHDNFNVPVYGSWIFDTPTTQTLKFDLILSAHTLEHFSQPINTIKLWATLLEKDGDLIIVVPEGTDTENPDHYCFFTEESLAHCIREAGLYVNQLKINQYVPHERFIYARASRRAAPFHAPGLIGQSWTRMEEVAFISRAIPTLGSMLEIGTASGVTAALIADRMKLATITCIDIYNEFAAPRISDWVANRRQNMSLFIGTSRQYLEETGGNKKHDVVFVDGGHHVAECYDDLEVAKAVLADQGTILVHDYGDPFNFGVKHAVDMFCADHGFEHVTTFHSIALLKKRREDS